MRKKMLLSLSLVSVSVLSDSTQIWTEVHPSISLQPWRHYLNFLYPAVWNGHTSNCFIQNFSWIIMETTNKWRKETTISKASKSQRNRSKDYVDRKNYLQMRKVLLRGFKNISLWWHAWKITTSNKSGGPLTTLSIWTASIDLQNEVFGEATNVKISS